MKNMVQEYKIYNEDKTQSTKTDFSNIRYLAVSQLLIDEATSENSGLKPNEIFKYGVFSAILYSFLSKLYSLKDLMSYSDSVSLEKEIKTFNELRKTKFNDEELRCFFDDLTEKYIENHSDNIFLLTQTQEWTNVSYKEKKKH